MMVFKIFKEANDDKSITSRGNRGKTSVLETANSAMERHWSNPDGSRLSKLRLAQILPLYD
jgi:hypothetical protein